MVGERGDSQPMEFISATKTIIYLLMSITRKYYDVELAVYLCGGSIIHLPCEEPGIFVRGGGRVQVNLTKKALAFFFCFFFV